MTLAPRQIHLDFHTSEAIPDIAANFDPRTFAETARKAEASSITVFARCHHGWLYYPSKRFPELIHPNLKNHNLLLEQVRALHDAGIKARYISRFSGIIIPRTTHSRVADQKAGALTRSPLYRGGLSPVVVR